MRNKTTYEMEDVMGLITRDLAEKGLAPDPGSVVIRAAVAGVQVLPSDIDIDVNVSWVGVIVPAGPPSAVLTTITHHGGRELSEPPAVLRDLFDEAPEPGAGPAIEIGSVTTASEQLTRSTSGPFAPDKVKRRLTGLDGESAEYPGPSRQGGR
jgi:hypothetical protein